MHQVRGNARHSGELRQGRWPGISEGGVQEGEPGRGAVEAPDEGLSPLAEEAFPASLVQTIGREAPGEEVILVEGGLGAPGFEAPSGELRIVGLRDLFRAPLPGRQAFGQGQGIEKARGIGEGDLGLGGHGRGQRSFSLVAR